VPLEVNSGLRDQPNNAGRNGPAPARSTSDGTRDGTVAEQILDHGGDVIHLDQPAQRAAMRDLLAMLMASLVRSPAPQPGHQTKGNGTRKTQEQRRGGGRGEGRSVRTVYGVAGDNLFIVRITTDDVPC
jgi:hypothetical protein